MHTTQPGAFFKCGHYPIFVCSQFLTKLTLTEQGRVLRYIITRRIVTEFVVIYLNGETVKPTN